MPEGGLNSDRSHVPEEPPPLLRAWCRLYLAVLAWLAFLILAFYGFARRFAP
jgi:hypothetical protein